MIAQQTGQEREYVLVAPANAVGEHFMKTLQKRGIPFAAITNNKQDAERVAKLGAAHVVLIDTADHETWALPEFRIGDVYVFEHSVTLCCRYLQICRNWTSAAIYVIARRPNPRLIYKALGADYIVCTKASEVAFLIDNENGRKGSR